MIKGCVNMNIYWLIKDGCGADEEADIEVVWECAKGKTKHKKYVYGDK